MKRFVAVCVVVALIAAVGVFVSGKVSAADSGAKQESVLRHVVLFKYKDGTSDADIEKVRTAFLNLKNGIDAVRGIECGTNNSPEKLDQGFTHCFLLTFDDAKGRDTYLAHPLHKEFGKLLGPFLDKVLVIDFVPQR